MSYILNNNFCEFFNVNVLHFLVKEMLSLLKTCYFEYYNVITLEIQLFPSSQFLCIAFYAL